MSRTAARPTITSLALAVAAALVLGACGGSSPPPPAPSCTDGAKNGTETAADCGGSCPLDCANGQGCAIGGDCTSGFCNTTTHLCAAPACNDGFKNGTETALDCGGSCATKCANGQGCAIGGDCTSTFCNPTTHQCAAPTCGDGFKNGTETDRDCGGSCPSDCATGLSCLVDGDCVSGACDPITKVCIAVACTASGNACPAGPGACCSGLCDGGTCVEPCKPNGTTCSAAGECCTNVCGVGTPRSCEPPPICKANTTSCLADTECCSGSCNFDPVAASSTCGDPCQGNGGPCGFNSGCCSDYCDPTKLCATEPPCKTNGFSCASDATCCDGYCNPVTQQCAAPVSTCKAPAATCTLNGECCSGACDNPTQATDAGRCTTTAFCKTPGASCLSAGDCCSLSCLGGVCANTECKVTGTTCGAAGECCTGSCSTTCQALPPLSGGSACKTLGDACAARTECCSSNCQGGKCTPAYLCHAPEDLCYRDEDCCSGMCSAPSPQTSPPTPGRCEQKSGGCNQGGAPCDGASNCCSRLCKDLGAGVTVCAPASGCRMTGDFCDQTEACCGGSPDTINPGGYGIYCDSVGTSPGPTQYDTSTKDERICTGGQACNPPGNICGGQGQVPASQNCCNGKAKVCKQDVNDIWRCFGGGSTTCPTGYDFNNPACCIPAGDTCQFRDQCCNFAPCVPDGAGVLKCTEPTCTALHGSCAGADDSSCCAGTVCTWGGSSFSCEVPASCKSNDEACTVASDCCSNNCIEGGCAPPCSGTSGACTTSGDCCTGLGCVIPGGTTSGTCQSASTCAPTAGTCSVSAECCKAPTEQCIAGKCAVPQACKTQLQSCTTTGDCCTQSPALSCVAANGTACTDGVGCTCQSCKAATQSCGTTADCCFGLTCDAGTCKTCVTVGATCTQQGNCCDGLTCADTTFGDPCAGGTCACDACLVKGSSCSANGPSCCGIGVDCLTPLRNGCSADDTDCTCQDQPQ